MRNDDTLISVTAEGVAEAEFTSVRYSLSASSKGKTAPEAKANLRVMRDALYAVLGAKAEEAGVNLDRLETSLTVGPQIRYDRTSGDRRQDGYLANYSLRFTGTEVGAATALHDALTEISLVSVDSPEFLVDASTDLDARAFEDGAKKAKAAFTQQCGVLEMNADDFEIKSWSSHRAGGGHRGEIVALAACESTEEGKSPIFVSGGKAEVRLNCVLSFGKKRV